MFRQLHSPSDRRICLRMCLHVSFLFSCLQSVSVYTLPYCNPVSMSQPMRRT